MWADGRARRGGQTSLNEGLKSTTRAAAIAPLALAQGCARHTGSATSVFTHSRWREGRGARGGERSRGKSVKTFSGSRGTVRAMPPNPGFRRARKLSHPPVFFVSEVAGDSLLASPHHLPRKARHGDGPAAVGRGGELGTTERRRRAVVLPCPRPPLLSPAPAARDGLMVTSTSHHRIRTRPHATPRPPLTPSHHLPISGRCPLHPPARRVRLVPHPGCGVCVRHSSRHAGGPGVVEEGERGERREFEFRCAHSCGPARPACRPSRAGHTPFCASRIHARLSSPNHTPRSPPPPCGTTPPAPSPSLSPRTTRRRGCPGRSTSY